MERLSGSQSVEERLDWMETWPMAPDIQLLLDAHWEITGYENQRSAELALAAFLGFAFERECNLVGWVFVHEVPQERYETTLEERLQMVESVDWVCDADVSHEVRLKVAETLSQADRDNVFGIWKTVLRDGQLSEKQVQRALDYFLSEGAIEKSGRNEKGIIYSQKDRQLEEYVSRYGEAQAPVPDMAPSIQPI